VPDAVAREGTARLDAAARDDAETHAVAGAAILAAAGWPCDRAALETSRNVPAAIACAAADHDAAVIVTGTRGRSRIAAALLGSTAEGIVRHAGRPVLLVPTAPDR
ncbi:MAG: universal stress protein, partial [Solirubrobacteraceae bacterium]